MTVFYDWKHIYEENTKCIETSFYVKKILPGLKRQGYQPNNKSILWQKYISLSPRYFNHQN